MFGLGKKRSKLGKYLDKYNIKQSDIAEKSKVGDMTISRLCNEADYRPKISTASKVKKALKSMGHDLPDDYFGM